MSNGLCQIYLAWTTELLPYLGKSLDNQCQALLNMAADLKRPVPKNMN